MEPGIIFVVANFGDTCAAAARVSKKCIETHTDNGLCVARWKIGNTFLKCGGGGIGKPERQTLRT